MKTILTTIALCAGLAAPVSAATIVAWESTNTEARLAATESGDFVTQFSLGRSAGLEFNTGGTYNSRDWYIGEGKLQALAANDSLFFGFSSSEGYDLTSLSIGYDRSPTGPSAISIDFFISNVFQATIFDDFDVADNSSAATTIDLSAYDGVQNGFFRLTGWNATSSQGTFDIENRSAFGGRGIVLTGELSAVPLPAGALLLLGGIAALGAARRRT